jgi:cytochrome c5
MVTHTRYLIVIAVTAFLTACGEDNTPGPTAGNEPQKPAAETVTIAPAATSAPAAALPADEETTGKPAAIPVAEPEAGPAAGEMTASAPKPVALSHSVVYQEEIYKNWPYTAAPTPASPPSVSEMVEDKVTAVTAVVEEKLETASTTAVKQAKEAVAETVAAVSLPSPAAATAPEPVIAAAPSETVAAATTEATGVPVDGGQIYNTYCAICHKGGMNAAPKFGSKPLWAKPIAQGRETVYANAINGLRGMPPRGGFPNLTDEEVKAATDYMINASGGWGN